MMWHRQGSSGEVAKHLTGLGLMPRLDVVAPPPLPTGTVDFADRYRGTLIWGASGDALGRPGEGRTASQIRERYGRLENFRRWRGWRRGPIGTVTDDTQMSMCVAKSIIDTGRVDPDDLTEQFVDWLPSGRGVGRATTAAVIRLSYGLPWHAAGANSAGNGAAMRAAPIGLRFPRDPNELLIGAVTSAVVTHRNAMAATSAAMVAAGVAYCAQTDADRLNPDSFVSHIVAAGNCINDQGAPERKPGSTRPIRLTDRVCDVLSRLDQPHYEAFDYFRNGAFVLESLPAAIWCFLRYRDDPEEALIIAASQGRDADTVASMAGNFIGAYRGASALPYRWIRELEYRFELEWLADRLHAASGLGVDASA